MSNKLHQRGRWKAALKWVVPDKRIERVIADKES